MINLLLIDKILKSFQISSLIFKIVIFYITATYKCLVYLIFLPIFLLSLQIVLPFFWIINVIVIILLSIIRKINIIRDPIYIFNLKQSYECGFEYRIRGCGFSLQFYVVRFSFLLFDLEICLFIPLILRLKLIVNSIFVSFIFLLFIILIFIYELKIGAFNW